MLFRCCFTFFIGNVPEVYGDTFTIKACDSKLICVIDNILCDWPRYLVDNVRGMYQTEFAVI